jgi:hypothetical protein
MLDGLEAGIAQPFKGVTADGIVRPGLFAIERTGVSTEPIKAAAEAFLLALEDDQRAAASFAVDAPAWRRWNNTHLYLMRHGACMEQMAEAQRETALNLMRAGLSAIGYKTARDIMKLNHTIGEVTGSWEEYGEWVYWVSVFGRPSLDQPWGWQVDGHHLNLNYFVLGDQVVMTPAFFGSEPVYAETGKYAGTRVLQDEESLGLELMLALSAEQQRAATFSLTGHAIDGRLQGGAAGDNIELPYQGVRADDLSHGQRELLLRIAETYVGRMRDGHAAVKMAEVRRCLDETYFAWTGDTGPDSVFYYRVHSPVILIEFDHQRGVAFANDEPSRLHIHTVVRTPNGNDYGKDLLRQHYARYHK